MNNDLLDDEESPLIQHSGGDPRVLEKILLAAPAGMVIVDKGGMIVFFNTEAEKIFGYSSGEVTGQPVEVLLPERFRHDHTTQRTDFIEQPSDRTMGYDRNVLGRRKDGSEMPLEVGLSYIHLGATVLVSAVVMDISRRKRIEAEREELIGELQAALEKVKQLSGLLPICASCKNIRDDNGYWNQIESYIRDHSEADFSHGLCPECAKRLYPEVFNSNSSLP
jgi:PAS domain S-box-containing protein